MLKAPWQFFWVVGGGAKLPRRRDLSDRSRLANQYAQTKYISLFRPPIFIRQLYDSSESFPFGELWLTEEARSIVHDFVEISPYKVGLVAQLCGNCLSSDKAIRIFHRKSRISNYNNDVHIKIMGCSSVGRASDRRAADAGSIPRCGKGFSSQSQLSVQILLRCPYNPRVQSHALTSVCTLKILWSMSEFGGLWRH